MDMGWKIASAIAVVFAGFAADKIVDVGWKAATGHTPPRGDDEASATVTELILFGAISGILVAIIRRQALRGANRWYGGKGVDKLGLGNVPGNLQA